MNASFRRFEVLLPLRFNDGSAVPDGLLADTLTELEQRFGAVSSETQVIRGIWRSQGEIFRDDHVRVFVDIEDLTENRQLFVELKERLKARFAQLDIWITSYAVDII
jgi:hypothetical protein